MNKSDPEYFRQRRAECDLRYRHIVQGYPHPHIPGERPPYDPRREEIIALVREVFADDLPDALDALGVGRRP